MNDRAEWLRQRQRGIGGSDVSAILGLSPWKTPLDIYLSKVEPIEDKEMSEPAYWGTVLEDVVAQEYARRSGRKVQRINAMLSHPDHDWMLANLDRTVVTEGSRARIGPDGRLAGADGLLECKTAGMYASADWGRDGDDDAIPTHYAAQAMWYLAVTGLPWIDFACLIGGQRFVTKRMERDEATIKALQQQCEAFWFDHVLKRNPPPCTNVTDVTKRWPEDTGEAIEANEELLVTYNEARALREVIERAEKDLETRVEKLKLALQSASALTLAGKPLVTFKKAADSQRTDWQAAASQIKAWAIEQGIEGGVDAIRDLINANTSAVKGSRRFVFVKQK